MKPCVLGGKLRRTTLQKTEMKFVPIYVIRLSAFENEALCLRNEIYDIRILGTGKWSPALIEGSSGLLQIRRQLCKVEIKSCSVSDKKPYIYEMQYCTVLCILNEFDTKLGKS